MTHNILQPLLEDSVGPYFPHAFTEAFRNDLTRHEGLVCRPAGEVIHYEGRIIDSDGDLVMPALIEFWQADPMGRYRTSANRGDEALDPWFEGFGRQYSEDGIYRLTTVKPGPVACEGGGLRAPHITITLFCDGISKLVTQLFFPADPHNGNDPILGALAPDVADRLIAEKVDERDGAPVFRRDIVLRGPSETPFFDDIES